MLQIVLTILYSSMCSIDYMGKMKMIVTYFEICVILFASMSLCNIFYYVCFINFLVPPDVFPLPKVDTADNSTEPVRHGPGDEIVTKHYYVPCKICTGPFQQLQKITVFILK